MEASTSDSNSAATRRLTPTPQLISMAPDLLPEGAHSFQPAISSILASRDTTSVDLVSFSVDVEALINLNVLQDRQQTRVLLLPPQGAMRADVEKLAKETAEGLEIREINRTRVPETVHLKLLILTRSDGRTFAITGSSNYTNRGTSTAGKPNAECSLLVPLGGATESALRKLFNDLWEHGSDPLHPDRFESRRESQGESTSLYLLEYQEEALNAIKARYAKHSKEIRGTVLSLPTGAGKTMVAVRFLLDAVLTQPDRRVLWLAPYAELLIQAASTFEALSNYRRPDDLVIPTEGEVTNGGQQDDVNVEFTTIASAYAGETLIAEPAVVVVDEAHFGATDKRKMAPHLRKAYPNAFFLGLTATPFRKDLAENRDIVKLFGEVHYVRADSIAKVRDGMGRPVLAEVDAQVIKTGYRIARIEEAALEAAELEGQILREFNDPKRNASIAKAWSPSMGPTLVFAIDVDHANALARAFEDRHRTAKIQVVHSQPIPKSVPSIVRGHGKEPLSRPERRRIHKLFRERGIDVLVAVNIYTMGVDFPATETLFMARPTLSSVLYSQMLGRGLRGPAFGGKERIRVLDFVDQMDTHEHLKERIMRYQLGHEAGSGLDRQIDRARQLWNAKREASPAEVIQVLEDAPGVYRVLRKSGKAVERRQWKWVSSIDSAVRNGRSSGVIRPSDVVEYIQKPEKEGKPGASLLRLAESWGLLGESREER